MAFSFERVSFHCAAQGILQFPSPLPANLLRGALGSVLMRWPAAYARIFAPASKEGPSGLVQRPRPFVFRAAHLAGVTIQPGGDFAFDVHVFDRAAVVALIEAFSQVMQEGLGAKRSPVELLSVERTQVEVMPHVSQATSRALVNFATLTELKHGGQIVEEPQFSVLMLLIQARLLNLCNFYAATSMPELPLRWLDTARSVQMLHSDLKRITATRFSTHTGQRHPMGGFTGTVTYEGDLTAFVPYLQVAQYTGVGRQTSWGKGQLRISFDPFSKVRL